MIGLVNTLQKACTLLGDYGDDGSLPTLWDSLPTIVVLGGQVFFFLSVYILFTASHTAVSCCVCTRGGVEASEVAGGRF